MSAHYHTFVIACTIGLVYWWLHTPALDYYSLQAFAISVVLYFIVKHSGRGKLWHIAPTYMSVEMAIASFAFLLLIGTTGNLSSPLYPLSYIHLFFLVLATHPTTSLITTLLIMLFHYAGDPAPTFMETTELLALPVLWALFFFTKHQYQTVEQDKRIIQQEEATIDDLTASEAKLETFMQQFAIPKLDQIRQLAIFAGQNQAALLGQLDLLKTEIVTMLIGLRRAQPLHRQVQTEASTEIATSEPSHEEDLEIQGENSNETEN